MNFCSVCGHALILRVPPGDNRARAVCDQCGTIHYRNPKLVVGTLPVWHDRVLLCRRAIEPRRGFWTLPAGFMEIGETAGDGALRETLEEAGARIVLGPLFTMLDVVHVEQVHLFYRADLIDIDFEPGEESLEVQLFGEDDMPWGEIAFPTVSLTLKHYFADRARGEFGVHTGAIEWPLRMQHAAPAPVVVAP